MIKNIVIPVAVQIIADDFGWHNGRDGRSVGKPSRSGLPRNHEPQDYTVMNEIGRAIGQKVLMPMVIGEWDKDNLLTKLPFATYAGTEWDRAAEINMRKAEKCAEIAENSEYVEYAYHGLLHGYYRNGKQVSENEYCRASYDEATGTFSKKVREFLSDEELQEYFDTFFKIYHSWGFQKKIRSIVFPCSVNAEPEQLDGYTKMMRKNGFLYWANQWKKLNDTTVVLNGVTFMRKAHVGADWDQYDFDPMMLLDHCSNVFHDDVRRIPSCSGFHWTNFLRMEPTNNMERLNDWVKYFRRQNSIYGQMLSKDIAFAGSQALYSRYATVSENGDMVTVDLTDVDAQNAAELSDTFYISVQTTGKIKVDPRSCEGGVMTLYDEFPSHKTWEITRINNSKQITFKRV